MAGIKDIVKQMDDASKAFDGVIAKTEKALYDAALTSVKELELDSQGNIKTTTANLKRLQQIKIQLAKAAGNKEYLKGVKELSDVFDKIYTRQQAFYYNSAFPEKTMGMNAKSRLELMRQVAVQNTIEGLTGAGLASNVTDPLNRILLRAVTSGEKYSDLTKELRDSIISSPQGEGTLSRYAKTYATTALTQYAGQNNKLFTDDLGASWFRYVGSEIETTREFCQLMLQKEYIHRSEFPSILKGDITINGKVHHCKMNPKTGLPQGMIDGTNEDNLQVNVGGWNCRHQLVPVAAAAVPQDIREAVEGKIQKPKPQKQSVQGQFSKDEFNKAFAATPVKNESISNKGIFSNTPIPQKNLHMLLHSATFKPEAVDISDIIPVKANLHAPSIKSLADKFVNEGTTGITAKGVKVGGKVYVIEGQADLAVKKMGGIKQTQMEIAEVSQAEFDKYATPAPISTPAPATKPATTVKVAPTPATATTTMPKIEGSTKEIIKKVVDFAPESTNNTPMKAHHQFKVVSTIGVRVQKIMDDTGVDHATAKLMEKAVQDFSHEWDTEIRAIQQGQIVRIHKHKIADIATNANYIEEYIAKAPKWAGGTVYRGIAVTPDTYRQILSDLKGGNMNMLGTASWTTNPKMAQLYSKPKNTATSERIVFKIQKQTRATSIKHLSVWQAEDEVVSSKLNRYGIVNEYYQNGTHYIEVKQTY